MDFAIEMFRDTDWEGVREVYREGIATGNATFETAVPAWQEWDRQHLPAGRLVARGDGRVVGWAGLSPVTDRCAYSGVAEISVYVAGAARGKGIGKALLHKLIDASEEAGIWTLQAGMFPENKASIALHRSCGFREVGRRERLGQSQGEWRDVLLMERRSQVIGSPSHPMIPEVT